MTRTDLAIWKAGRNSAWAKTFTEIKLLFIGTLLVSPDYDETRKAQLEKELEKLRAKYGFSLERRHNPLEAAQHRYMRQVNDSIRKHARIWDEALRLQDMPEAVVSPDPLDQDEAMEEFRTMIAQRNARLNQKHNPEKYADWK
jgi:hypothetical protein